jgi:phosphoribosylformylglycinamidine synthase
VFRNLQMSFAAGGDASAASPWLRMFRNARRWVG